MSSPPFLERYTRGFPPSINIGQLCIEFFGGDETTCQKRSAMGLLTHNTNDGEKAGREQTIYAQNGGANDDRDRYNTPYTVAHLDDEAVQPACLRIKKKLRLERVYNFIDFFHMFRVSKI